jgi:hypothetical protein
MCSKIAFIVFFFSFMDSLQEESSTWAKRTIDVASVTEDTKTINEIHDAVLGNQMFAVDAPDGEHDLEDVVSVLQTGSFGMNSVDLLSLSRKIQAGYIKKCVQ